MGLAAEEVIEPISPWAKAPEQQPHAANWRKNLAALLTAPETSSQKEGRLPYARGIEAVQRADMAESRPPARATIQLAPVWFE